MIEEKRNEKQADLMPDYMWQDEAAYYLKTTTRKIAMYRKKGLLKAGKLGKSYVYKRTWCDEFMEEWAGYDLSNYQKIVESINEKNWRSRHGY